MICNEFRFEKNILSGSLIIVGFLSGLFFAGVQLLQKYGYVNTVNWDKLGNDTSTKIQHLGTHVDVGDVYSLFHTLGTAVSSGLGVGILWPGL